MVDCIPEGDTACPSAQIVALIDKAGQSEGGNDQRLAEQTVKPYVINRKNFLFCDTEKGADASAAVMDIIETAKRNRLDVYRYLLHLLTVLPEWGENPTASQIESVLLWSMGLPPFCRQMYSQVQ